MQEDKEHPNYYAVIPAHVRYADIPANAKLLYGEITALANKKGYCWARNQYFADIYNIHKNSVGRLISILAEHKFIHVELIPSEKGSEVSRRILIGINKIVEGGINKIVEGGINKIVEDNNTSINITRKNNSSSHRVDNSTEELVEYFNQKFGKSYRVTRDRLKKVSSRLATYSIEECKKAIDNLRSSKFHNGENDRGWVADFDFLFRSDEQIDKFLNFDEVKPNHYKNFNEL